MKKIIFISIVILSASVIFANLKFEEKPDDFTNEKVLTLSVKSIEQHRHRGPSVLFISCFPESRINIQLAFNGTIYPDDVDGTRGMIVSITHKFDTAEKAYTTNWHMNIAKYRNAWYRGDKEIFLNEAMTANQLNIRLNRNGDIVRFRMENSSGYLKKIKEACK